MSSCPKIPHVLKLGDHGEPLSNFMKILSFGETPNKYKEGSKRCNARWKKLKNQQGCRHELTVVSSLLPGTPLPAQAIRKKRLIMRVGTTLAVWVHNMKFSNIQWHDFHVLSHTKERGAVGSDVHGSRLVDTLKRVKEDQASCVADALGHRRRLGSFFRARCKWHAPLSSSVPWQLTIHYGGRP
jgi:hypothetical protein